MEQNRTSSQSAIFPHARSQTKTVFESLSFAKVIILKSVLYFSCCLSEGSLGVHRATFYRNLKVPPNANRNIGKHPQALISHSKPIISLNS